MDFEDENDTPMFGEVADNKDMISVNILTLNGDSKSYEIFRSNTIEELIAKYMKDNGYKNSNVTVTFSFNGKVLKGNETIQSANIESDDNIHALVRMRGGN